MYIYIEMKEEQLRTMLKGRRRERAVQDGFYDGRFMTKTVPNKKKVKDKRICRQKIQIDSYTS